MSDFQSLNVLGYHSCDRNKARFHHEGTYAGQ